MMKTKMEVEMIIGPFEIIDVIMPVGKSLAMWGCKIVWFPD